MNIELRHLRYFIAVAEELSFSRAAERVHIDKTPLSRTVRDLEDELGVQLFVRGPRRLMLTPAGTRLLEEARKLFIRFERTKRAVRQTHSIHQAPLRVGVADGLAQPRLAECFARWPPVAPAVPLELAEMRANELVAALNREDVDVGFSFGVPESESLAQEMVWSYPLMALLPLGHELTRVAVLSLDEVVCFPMIACNANYKPGMRQQMDAILVRCSRVPTIVAEACTFTGCVTRIAAGLGIGLADSGHADTLRRDDIVAVPLGDDVRVHTYLLHKPRRFGLPETVQRFLAHAKSLY